MIELPRKLITLLTVTISRSRTTSLGPRMGRDRTRVALTLLVCCVQRNKAGFQSQLAACTNSTAIRSHKLLLLAHNTKNTKIYTTNCLCEYDILKHTWTMSTEHTAQSQCFWNVYPCLNDWWLFSTEPTAGNRLCQIFVTSSPLCGNLTDLSQTPHMLTTPPSGQCIQCSWLQQWPTVAKSFTEILEMKITPTVGSKTVLKILIWIVSYSCSMY